MTKEQRDELRAWAENSNLWRATVHHRGGGISVGSMQREMASTELIDLLDAADEAERLREENDYYRAQLDPNRVTRLD